MCPSDSTWLTSCQNLRSDPSRLWLNSPLPPTQPIERSRLSAPLRCHQPWGWSCEYGCRGGGNVKISFIDFQGLGNDGKLSYRFRRFHKPAFPRPGAPVCKLCAMGWYSLLAWRCSSRPLFLRSVEVYLIRRLCLKAGVRTALIVESDVLPDSTSGLADRADGHAPTDDGAVAAGDTVGQYLLVQCSQIDGLRHGVRRCRFPPSHP